MCESLAKKTHSAYLATMNMMHSVGYIFLYADGKKKEKKNDSRLDFAIFLAAKKKSQRDSWINLKNARAFIITLTLTACTNCPASLVALLSEP